MTIRYLIINDANDDFFNSGGDQDDYVNYLLDMEYNRYPSTLIDIPVTEEELGDMAYYDALGRSNIPDNLPTDVPPGKLVI